MIFKRSYCLTSVITLGMFALGYACWMLPTSASYGNGPYKEWWFMVGGWLLMWAGAAGFVASLIWWVIAGIISCVRSPHPKS